MVDYTEYRETNELHGRKTWQREQLLKIGLLQDGMSTILLYKREDR
jgi:hypothetical protein